MARRRSVGSFLRLAPGVLALGVAAVASAATAPRVVLAGRVDGVTSVGGGVAALRDGEVLLLDASGRAVGGCLRASATAGAARRPDRTARSREEVLGEAGFSDEDVSPEAEDLLDDEGLEPPSRRRPVEAAAGPPRALALAGAGDAVWIGTADGLWRLDARDGACLPAALGGQEISVIAARGATVAAYGGATLWRSRDGGLTFDVAAVPTSRVHALAVADDELIFAADEDGVVELDAARGVVARLEGRVDALAACAGDASEVVALAGDGVHRLDAAGRDVLIGPRPPVRALACGPEGLVAVGLGLWSSPDGSLWREDPGTLGRELSGVAWAAGHAWLAGDNGLETSEPHEDAGADGLRAPSAPRRRAVAGDRPPPAWAGLLPRIALAFDGWTESTGVAGWRLWVRLTVSLGRRWQRTPTENLEDLR